MFANSKLVHFYQDLQEVGLNPHAGVIMMQNIMKVEHIHHTNFNYSSIGSLFSKYFGFPPISIGITENSLSQNPNTFSLVNKKVKTCFWALREYMESNWKKNRHHE